MRLPSQDSARDTTATEDPTVGSFDRIYHAHFGFVWRNARRLGIPEASADDVVQDVFVIVQRRISDFDGRTALKAWIFGILLRVARDHRRSFRRKGGRCIPLDEVSHGDVAAAEGPTPSELAERSERIHLLDALLDQLDEDKRTLLILSELEQCTLREIAEMLGSNTNTVHSRLRAAKRDFDKVYTRWLADQGDAS
ncbi:MAG TPA: RNA polymerase sigma factor [Polyangiaceae bacterium]|nr:RNA polymerase sigma factor [Polyangiaceae bacterium]